MRIMVTSFKFLGTQFAKFRLKLKKVGKTSRPFRYDLNQIKSLMIIQ